MGEQLSNLLRKVRQRPLATAATLLALLLAVGLFLRGSRLAELQVALADAGTEWQRMETNLRRAHNLALHVEEIQAAEESIRERLLRPSEVAINYDYFYQLEREMGVRLTALNQGSVIDTGNRRVAGLPRLTHFSAVAYTIAVEGSFADVLNFMSRLEHGRFFIRISAINFSSSPQGSGQLVNATLQCQVLGVLQ